MLKLVFSYLVIVLVCSGCKPYGEDIIIDSGSKLLPIVFVHGYLGNGDSYELQAMRFAQNGYPMDRLYAYDWNTLNGSNNTRGLEDFIEDVLRITGADKVELVGHSLGGALSYNYCKKPTNASKIAHLVLLAPYLEDRTTLPSDDIPTLNIWTLADYVVTDGAPLPGATNIALTDEDHNEVASCKAAFEAMFSLFTGTAPLNPEILPEENLLISGKSFSFVENLPGKGAIIKVYEVDPSTGNRIRSRPDYSFRVNSNNEWGPMQARPGAYYEFEVSTGKPGDRTLNFYREPFIRSNKLVYLRTYPPPGSIIHIGLNALIPSPEDEAVCIFYNTPRTVLLGRDELSIQGVSLNRENITGKELNTIALFLYDVNRNKITDSSPSDLFGPQTIKAVDFYFPASTLIAIKFELNGRILNLPARSSRSGGIGVAVFN
jgi:predicted alpha/beta hydrolase family esterase